jgi:hypothetical protein
MGYPISQQQQAQVNNIQNKVTVQAKSFTNSLEAMVPVKLRNNLGFGVNNQFSINPLVMNNNSPMAIMANLQGVYLKQ